jgi:hypothetical protein
MTTKEALAQNIKEWLQLEKEMKTLQHEIKERKKKKLLLTNSLINTMKNKDIDCIDMSEGKIIYTQNKTKTPLNKVYLNNCLTKYFAKQPNVQVDGIVQYILDMREVVLKDTIKHKPIKS